MVTPERRISASPDESDNRFLECAHASGADYLVTGNKRHFPFPAYEGTAIVSPAEFTQIVIA
jgi:predicted nucleic acid-binding protein